MGVLNLHRVAIIGFGEAGQAYAQGWNDLGASASAFSIAAFDTKTASSDVSVRDAKLADYQTYKVDGCKEISQSLKGASVIISLVTADQAYEAACNTAKHLEKGALFFDGNSCAPSTKLQSAKAIESAGGRYVDMAIVAPVHPTLHQTPVLLSGPHAKEAMQEVGYLNLAAKLIDGPVGRASAIKMTRSIMMKGLEALMLECVLAGRKAGVEDTVLESLEVTYPGFGWKDRAAYMFERVMTHGKRRAAEMREVAITVADLELNNGMAAATVDWHQQIGDLELDASTLEGQPYGAYADLVLENLGKNKDE